MSNELSRGNVRLNDGLGHNAQERIGFAVVCEMLPEGANWGDRLTTKMAREIVEAATAAERVRSQIVALAWGETHEAHVTVNARNAARKIAYAIRGSNVETNRPKTAPGNL